MRATGRTGTSVWRSNRAPEHFPDVVGQIVGAVLRRNFQEGDFCLSKSLALDRISHERPLAVVAMTLVLDRQRWKTLPVYDDEIDALLDAALGYSTCSFRPVRLT
jgi:hypothetical protein